MKTLLAASLGAFFSLLATTVASAAPATIAAGLTFGSGERVDGSGRIVEEVRPLEGFTAVHVSGPVNVELKSSDRDSVTVRTDDNLTALIETRVSEGARSVLEIGVRPGAAFRTSRTPVVIVRFRALNELVMRGSGDVRADRIDADDLAVSMSGSGDARIESLTAKRLAAVLAGSGDLRVRAGRAEEQAYKVAGSGEVHAGALEGRRVMVSIAGSGDAVVNATESLEASVAGSGDVVYRGSPRISQRVRGSGSVRRAR